MKYFAKDIPTESADQIAMLKRIGKEVTNKKFNQEIYEDIVACAITIPFENSPEGMTIGIENVPKERGLDFEFCFFINPWLYEDMGEELIEVKNMVAKLLEIIPDAIVVFSDDPFDCNMDSAMPEYNESYNDHHFKTSSPDRWIEMFEDLQRSDD